MRLPAKDEPGGDREGSLTRETVLEVLRENDIDIKHLGGALHQSMVEAGDDGGGRESGGQDRAGG
ncbi:MAG: hypothetical protein AB1648_09880 [Pseudomonadota bacterium]